MAKRFGCQNVQCVQILGHAVLNDRLIRNRGVNSKLVNPMLSRKSVSILTLTVAVIAGVASIAGYIALNLFAAGEVSIKDINLNPQSFNNTRVRVNGYVVDTSCYMFGPKYVLRDDSSEIALGGKGGTGNVDLSGYVSFVFDGENYTQTEDMFMSVEGHVRYIGFVTDAPPYCVEVENAELKTARWDVVALTTQQIRVEVEKTNYLVGQDVMFRVFNKNLSNEPILAGVSNIYFRVSTSEGESILDRHSFMTWPADFMIDPGEEIELHGVLPPWIQINSRNMQVPPDAYTINIGMEAMGGSVNLLLKIAIAAL